MPRTIFVNPFKTHDVSEFPGVLQPLEDAPRRAPTATHPRASLAPRTSDRRGSEKLEEEDGKPSDEVPRRPDSDASSGVVNHGMTIEALRAEIIADLAASDSDTPYDRRLRKTGLMLDEH